MCFDLCLLHFDALRRDDIAEKPNFVLLKLTFLEIDRQQPFLQLIKHPLNSLYVLFSLTFNVDENIIKIYNNKKVKLFRQNIIDVNLKRG